MDQEEVALTSLSHTIVALAICSASQALEILKCTSPDFAREKVLLHGLAIACAEAVRELAPEPSCGPDLETLLVVKVETDMEDETGAFEQGARTMSALVSLAYDDDHESIRTMIDKMFREEASRRDVEVGAATMMHMVTAWRWLSNEMIETGTIDIC